MSPVTTGMMMASQAMARAASPRSQAARGIKPVAAAQWWPTSIVGTLTSPRLAGLREWQGQKYPTTQWPAIIDADTHERLVKLFGDPARRKHVVRAPAHLLSGIATCPKCGRGLHYRRHPSDRADSYGCVKGPAGCGLGRLSSCVDVSVSSLSAPA
jgi:site-specific DNA recombinase